MPSRAQDRRRLARLARRVRRDADVERLALADRRRQRAHRLLERGVGVEAVRVEDVEVVDADAAQALVQARQHVLARAAALAVRARPHVPAGLAGDDQLVAVGREVLAQDPPEVDLGAAVRRAVVVGQVEVGDPEVEGGVDHLPLLRERRRVAEVVPEPQGEQRQLEAAAPAEAVGHGVVAIGGGLVGHRAGSGSVGVGDRVHHAAPAAASRLARPARPPARRPPARPCPPPSEGDTRPAGVRRRHVHRRHVEGPDEPGSARARRGRSRRTPGSRRRSRRSRRGASRPAADRRPP